MGFRGFLAPGEPAVEREIDRIMTHRDKYGGVAAEHLAGYDVPTLLKIAAKLVHITKREMRCGYSHHDLGYLLSTILRERKKRLDAEFQWTDRHKARFLSVNNKLLDACEKGWQEALATAEVLEKRIEQKDSLLKDYDVKVKLSAWPRIKGDQEWVVSEYLGTESLRSMDGCLRYGDNKYDPLRLNEEGFKPSITIDKSLNWTDKLPFSREFDNEYICYAMYEMLGGYIAYWSISDVLSIGFVRAKAVITHEYCEGFLRRHVDSRRRSEKIWEQFDAE
jgi:hypothetical protein